MMSQAPSPGRAPDPAFLAPPIAKRWQQHVGVTFVCAARPVRILVIDHAAEGVALAKLLEPWFRVTLRPLGGRSTEDLSVFQGVIVGSAGRLDDRSEGCRQLRAEGYAGVILAICVDVAEGDALLDAGADDFATAPFEARELVTRVRASARRAAAQTTLRWGTMELDRVQREVRLGGRSVSLTERECDMLVCLIEAAGNVVSRATLRERVWKRKEEGGSNLVEVHLSRLRDKLGDDASVIETVRRAGYRLRK
jgi:DNA-binding response OmpR family regulator